MNSTKTNPKNDRVKRDYLVWLKEAKQRSVTTVEQVRYAIDRLDTYTGFKDFGTFNKDQALGFKRELLATKAKRSGKTVSISTVHYTLQAIKDFLAWLHGCRDYRPRIPVPDIAYLNLTTGEQRQAHASRPRKYASLDEYRTALFAMPRFGSVVFWLSVQAGDALRWWISMLLDYCQHGAFRVRTSLTI